MKRTLRTSHYELVDEEGDWRGYWGKHLHSTQYQTMNYWQKVRQQSLIEGDIDKRVRFKVHDRVRLKVQCRAQRGMQLKVSQSAGESAVESAWESASEGAAETATQSAVESAGKVHRRVRLKMQCRV